MKKTILKNFSVFQKFGLKILFLFLFFCLSAGIKAQDIQVPSSQVRLLKSFKINERPTGVLAPSANALYSNVTNFSGFGYNNGIAGPDPSNPANTITSLVADSLVLISPLPFSVNAFTFSVVNNNAVDVLARPRIRFFAPDGTGGLPNTIVSGYSFNPITFTAGSVQVFSASVAAFAITNRSVWAGITFDNNIGATGATQAQLNLLGQGIFDPVDVGSSTDDYFQTDTSGSFFGGNPIGSSGYNFGGSPVANFGWELISAVALPVTLSNFNIQHTGLTNTLVWTTSQEFNSKYFSVQKSEDGNNFTEIGQVKAAGKSSVPLNYSFVDVKPAKGVNYYRIKMVDIDNSGKFSDIKNIKNLSLVTFNIFPNPVGTILTAELEVASDSKAHFSVTDNSGRVVLKQDENVTSGYNKISLDASILSKGNYYLKITYGKEELIQSFNKL